MNKYNYFVCRLLSRFQQSRIKIKRFLLFLDELKAGKDSFFDYLCQNEEEVVTYFEKMKNLRLAAILFLAHLSILANANHHNGHVRLVIYVLYEVPVRCVNYML